MAKARKTVDLGWLVDQANHAMLHSADNLKEHRYGIASLVEAALHKGNSYYGFNYLSDYAMRLSENGKSVGIIREEGKDNVFPDDSRRYYHYPKHGKRA